MCIMNKIQRHCTKCSIKLETIKIVEASLSHLTLVVLCAADWLLDQLFDLLLKIANYRLKLERLRN